MWTLFAVCLYTLRMTWNGLRRWAVEHARPISYGTGTLFVATWTVLRFFTQRTIFDLVGQQVLAGQWLRGDVAGAGIGTTNYLYKLFFLYMPLHALPGSPRLKLVLLTLVVNIATFMLIGLLVERLLRAFGIKPGMAFYAALIWLSAIAGSVFWMEFTNSRNLEVVGGLFLLYQGVCYVQRPSWKRLAGITAFCSVLFFADSLQLYMTAVPLAAYALSVNRGKPGWQIGAKLVAGIVMGYIGSKALFALAEHVLTLDYIQASSGSGLSVSFLEHGITGTARSFVHLYSGAADAGKAREVYNILFVIAGIAGVGYATWKRLVPRRLLMLVGYIIALDTAVYILSGQAQNGGTERYLIMTAPAVVLLFGSLQKVMGKFQPTVLVVLCGLVLCNGIFVGRAVAQASTNRYSSDAHLASVARYLRSNPSTLTYASMDTSLPLAYLSGSDLLAPLPLSCSGMVVSKTNTFYSKNAYQRHEQTPHADIAVVFDGSVIANTPSVCTEANVLTQLGQPSRTSHTDDGSVVLLYGTNISRKLHY